MHATLDDLVLAHYVTIDDLLQVQPEQLPHDRRSGSCPAGAALVVFLMEFGEP